MDDCLPDDPETIINLACICFKEKDYEKAREKFVEANNILGWQSDLVYNIALCYYQMGPGNYENAVRVQ